MAMIVPARCYDASIDTYTIENDAFQWSVAHLPNWSVVCRMILLYPCTVCGSLLALLLKLDVAVGLIPHTQKVALNKFVILDQFDCCHILSILHVKFMTIGFYCVCFLINNIYYI